MFRRSNNNGNTSNNSTPNPPKKAVPSVLSSDINILGNVISDGFLDINGRIEGNVRCYNATIREQGKIKGDVIAETVQIYGEVEGLVKAKTVNLYSNAKVTGVIMHESISIEDGAFIDGKFKRTDRVFIDEEETHQFSIDRLPQDEEDGNILDNLRLISSSEN